MGGLNLGIGLRVPRLTPREGGFVPRAVPWLFGWYDPSDLSTLYQDIAGTIPVTADGQPVGMMLDKSGRARHMVAIGNNTRPIFKDQSGLRYLQSDGVDDVMVAAPGFQTQMLISTAIRKSSDAAQSFIYFLDAGQVQLRGTISAGSANYFSRIGASPGATLSPLALAQAAPDTAVLSVAGVVATPVHRLRRNGVLVATDTQSQGSGQYGSDSSLFYLFATSSGTAVIACNFYGQAIYGVVPNDAQIALIERYLGRKAGLSL